jgi:hypothetical protein
VIRPAPATLLSIPLTLVCGLLAASMGPRAATAQQVLVDRGVQVAGLWCFPLLEDSLTYLYLPSRAELAVAEGDSTPVFSFLRYIDVQPGKDKDETRAVSEAGGGGLLTFLMLYNTPDEQVKAAQGALRTRLDNKSVKLRGPVVFEKARYTLVSSIVKGEDTTATGTASGYRALSTGEAPVLEGSRMAFSFSLSPKDSKLLMFELTFSGLTDNYDAEMTVDWAEVQQSQAFSAGASIYFVSADVEVGFEKLKKDGAIKLRVNGSNNQMEHLVETVYDKLLTLMFTPVKPETVPEDQRGGLMSAIGGLTRPNGPLGSRSLLGFGANVGFQLKDLQTSGKAVLNFKGRSERKVTHFISFNIGDLHQRYGSDTRFFRDVPLWDPAFQKREIYVGVDGDIEKEFSKIINSVTIFVEKQHQNGEVTDQTLVVRKSTFQNGQVPVTAAYGNRGDVNRTEWLKYRYKTTWQFQGGAVLSTDWTTSDAAMISLYTPFSRRTFAIDGDSTKLAKAGVRAAAIRIDYPFFGQKRHEQRTIRLAEKKEDQRFEVTLPNDVDDIDYSITWFLGEGGSKSTKGKDGSGVIFIDEVP